MTLNIRKREKSEYQFSIPTPKNTSPVVALYNPNSCKISFDTPHRINVFDYHEELKRRHSPIKKRSISVSDDSLVSKMQGAKDYIIIKSDIFIFSAFEMTDFQMFIGGIKEVSKSSSKSILQLIDSKIVSAINIPLLLDSASEFGTREEQKGYEKAISEGRILVFSIDDFIKMKKIEITLV